LLSTLFLQNNARTLERTRHFGKVELLRACPAAIDLEDSGAPRSDFLKSRLIL
jgi:hypothetical protein